MAPRPGSFPATPPTFPGPHEVFSELPLGTWHLLANGRIFLLRINRVSGSEVDADISSGTIERASWNESTGELKFYRVTTITQEYRGYLMHADSNDDQWRLAGIFGDVTVGDQAGWYATQPR